MVLTKNYLKKKGKLVAEDSKITKKDLRKKRKMVVPIDEDEELTNEDDREYLKSKNFSDKQLENDIDVEPSNNGIELVNDLTQILLPKVDISDMQIGLPGVVQNDGQISIDTKCFYGIKLNDVDSNRKEYGIQQLATKSQEKRQQPKNVTFYERKVTLHKALSENEKKVAEFILRACNDGSFVLNHLEKYKEKNSGSGNIYCFSRMLSEHLIESGADLIRRRSIFESNITAVLSQSPYESFHDVDLTAEIDIIDNLDNDIDDISVRYGELPIYL
ncbi:hypothetical protein Tco_1382124, partial [Tanacetum coccineum]